MPPRPGSLRRSKSAGCRSGRRLPRAAPAVRSAESYYLRGRRCDSTQFSHDAGNRPHGVVIAVQELPNGILLVTSSNQGWIFEINREGEMVERILKKRGRK